MPNSEIFEGNVIPISDKNDCLELWRTFVELSITHSLHWHPIEGYGFNNIGIQNDNINELYIFTQFVPNQELYNFLTDNQIGRVWDIGDIDLRIDKICELELTNNHEPYFWKQVVKAINNNDDNEIARLGEIHNANPNPDGVNIVLQNIFQPRTFGEIVTNLNTEIMINNKQVYNFMGRMFLLRIDIGNSFLDTKRKYVLFLFVDDNYFQRTFIDELGLECTKINPM